MTARRIGVIAAMPALLAAALSTGMQIYYLLFFILLMMLFVGAISALWTLLTVRCSIKGMKQTVTRGDAMTTMLSVRHSCLLPVSAIYLELSVPSAFAPTQEVGITTPPFVTKNFRHMIRCPHRGVYQAGITAVSVTDAFGLFTFRRKTGSSLMTMEIRPKDMTLEVLSLKNSDMGPETRSTATEDNASPSDIRKWQQGDELKRVHWKLSLRKHEMMVRTYEESARPDTLVIPDLSQITALRDERLTMEDCICEACLGSARAQLTAGYPVRIPLTGAEPSELGGMLPSDLNGISDTIMRAQFDSPYRYEQVLAQMLGRLQRTGGAILITAHMSTRIIDMAMRMQRGGITVRLLWITDETRLETLEMLERARMIGVQIKTIHPWKQEKRRHTNIETDEYDA